MTDAKKYTLENLLYYNPITPDGFPSFRLKIYCDFEVGGAYEDWGFVAEWDGKVIAEGRNVEDLIKKIDAYILKVKEE